MGLFYCQGCQAYRDSKECDQYIHTNGADYCSDECAPVSVVLSNVLNNLSKIGEHDKLELGVEV